MNAYHAFAYRNRNFLLDIEQSYLYGLTPEALDAVSGGTANGHSTLMRKIRARLEWLLLKNRLKPLSFSEKQKEIERITSHSPKLAGLWMGVAHTCNLACEYCFANEPAYLGRNMLLDEATALRGVDYLIANGRDEKDLSLVFFGGEPLLNFKVIKSVVSYCRSREKEIGRKFTFSMTTNGTLLKPHIFAWLQDNRVQTMISMDGTRELHDLYRPTKSGKSSWDLIAENLEKLPNFGRYLAVRATVVDPDTDLVQCLRSLQELGFSDIRLSSVCPNSGMSDTTKNFTYAAWAKRYDQLVDYILATAPTIDEIPENGLKATVLALKQRAMRYFCCGTGRYYFYLDPEGDLYPCFRLMTPDRKERLGSLNEPLDQEKAGRFLKANVLETSCSECWARYLCGGPCFGDAFHTQGDLSTPDPQECARRQYIIKTGAYLLDHFGGEQGEQHPVRHPA